MVKKDSQRGAVVRVAAPVETPVQERRRLSAGAILSLIALAVLLIFIFQNTRDTRIRLVIPEVTMPLSTALLVAVAIGLFFGAYFMRRRR